MKWTSHILSVLLAAVIALTAQSAAVARTMPDATGQMVICTGTGPTMIYFDEDGNPTSPPQLCPDYALSLIVALDVPEIAVVATGVWQRASIDFVEPGRPVLRLGTPNARGPPVLI